VLRSVTWELACHMDFQSGELREAVCLSSSSSRQQSR
jgi:hypothetical protein